MEPSKTHSASLPQQGLTYPAGGCHSELRSGDLMQGGHEGANPHAGQREAINDTMDSAIVGTSHALEVTASRQRVEINCDEVETRPDGLISTSSQLISSLRNDSSEDTRESVSRNAFTRFDAYQILTEESKKINGPLARPFDLSKSERTCIIKLELANTLHSQLSVSQEQNLNSAIGLFITRVDKRFNDCKRNMRFFRKKNASWLSQPFINDIPQDLILKPEIVEVPTVPSVEFASSSKETKFTELNRRTQLRARKRLESLIKDEPLAKLIKTFSKVVTSDTSKLNAKSSRDLEAVINKSLESPNKPTEVLAKINQQTNPYTPEEALGILIDRKFSVDTYKFLRQDLNRRGFCAFPPYSKVASAKRECYSEQEVYCSEVEASVSLQGLLSHTFRRIVLLCDDLINSYCEREYLGELSCTFEGSWGFDGSTGQSLYKQKSPQDSSYDENSIFATTFVPLRIMQTCPKQTLWMNSTPQSFRSCRPLHIQYRKETKDLILAEKEYVEEQIRQLTPIVAVTSKGFIVKTTCDLTLSIIDGKVYNIIHNTFSQLRCPICKLTSTQFNDLELVFSKPVHEETIKNSLSPLHAFIRCLEFLLHLGYKNDPRVRQWRVSKSSVEGQITEDRKKRIQAEIKDRLGLLVDVVRPNSGTTNDGNTARRVFATTESRGIFAEILGLSRWLVDDIHIILVAINYGLPIDSEKFGNFCRDLARKYVEAYSWHPMTTTIHKILVHGQIIIQSTALPVGVLSEQAGESRNKFWRYDREHHSRKDDRKHTISDLFHRALESSDPVISNTRLSRRQTCIKRMPLPSLVIEMLKPFDCATNDDEDDDDERVACTETDDESEFSH